MKQIIWAINVKKIKNEIACFVSPTSTSKSVDIQFTIVLDKEKQQIIPTEEL